MKKVFILLMLCMAVFAGIASADWRGDFTWEPSTDPACTGYEILVDDVVVVADLPAVANAASFVLEDLTGQAIILRTLGLGPGAYEDSEPIIASKIPAGAGAFVGNFVYQAPD